MEFKKMKRASQITTYILVMKERTRSYHVIECARIKPSTLCKIFDASLVKSMSPSIGLGLAIVSSSKGPFSCKTVQTGTFQGETPYIEPDGSCKEQGMFDFPMEQVSSKEIRVDSNANSVEISEFDNDYEIQRRRKIGLANKGKVPWNKGRKHSEETRERIKRRTKEPLKDPKVKSC
ncbi:uncharacterized protein LOC111395602 isoform X2 [Olea europaea var. sylvestris]|uniref:uncharacterized protein LOC111395602 isoform X2 n=1 Tax=Olea europaea var. sylvestris TaxID=158386 RepID=UPI000C1CD2EF|nr:uncharacterized protein LOC111395602 isoform X2 [Olea europaea var. sylvestris]